MYKKIKRAIYSLIPIGILVEGALNVHVDVVQD